MFKIRTSDNFPLIVDHIPKQPLVYLDQCVLFDFAADREQGDIFTQMLHSKCGTLCISMAHIVETGKHSPSLPRYSRLEKFLQETGNSWILLNSNPDEVMKNEHNLFAGKSKTAPHLDAALAKEIFLKWDGKNVPSPTLAIQHWRDSPELRKKYLPIYADQGKRLKEAFDNARKTYRTNLAAKRNLDSQKYQWSPSKPPTEFIYRSLMRESIRTHEVFTKNNGSDFEHATVSMAYCDFVVLDRKWARRLRKTGIPSTAAKLYDVTELAEFLRDLSTFKTITPWTH